MSIKMTMKALSFGLWFAETYTATVSGYADTVDTMARLQNTVEGN